jgi:hypothetical protein
MSLKGLGKADREPRDIQADDFIKGANQRVTALKPKRQKTYAPCIFSLTAEVSKEIDRLALTPRNFRASRSDVVKAAVALFASLPEEDQIEKLKAIR